MFSRERSKAYKIFDDLYPSHREFIGISAIILLLISVFFARPILFDLVPFPSDLLSYWPMFHVEGLQIQNMNFADVIMQYYPYYIFNYNSIHALQLPLWNPYGAGGVPHIADMQSSIYYFLTWPIYLFGFTGSSLLIMYFAKFYLAGISSYYYLRSLKLRFYPSLLGTIGFMFFNFYIVWFHWPLVDFLFILPAMLYIIERIVGDGARGLKYYLAFAVLTAMCMFSSNPDGYSYLAVFVSVYFLFKVWAVRLKIHEAFDIAKNFAAFSILGIGLSAIQLLPFVEYLLNSYAWVSRTNGIIDYLPWQSMIMNFMPDYYGTNSLYLHTPFYASFTLYQSSAGYAGITLICLATFAILAKYRDRLVAFYLLSTIWVLGVIYNAPLIYDVTTLFPPFSLLMNTRLLFLLGFNVIVLGSIGLNEIMDRLSKDSDRDLMKNITVSCLLVLSAFLFLAYANGSFLEAYYYFRQGVGLIQIILTLASCALILATLLILYLLVKRAHSPRAKKLVVICLLLLVFLETGGHAMLYLPSVSQDTFNSATDPFAPIVSQGGLDRATSIDPVNHLSVYPTNIQMIYGVYDIRNYDAIEVKYNKQLRVACTNSSMSGNNFDEVNDNFLDFMGVRWVYSGTDLSKSIDINLSRTSIDINNTIGDLGNGLVVGQEFTSREANLSGIELLYTVKDIAGPCPDVTLSLVDEKANATVRNLTINASSLENGRWYMASFEPLSDSAGRAYLLNVSVNGSRDSGITLAMSTDDPLTGMRLYMNGQPVGGDLCMRTYYDNDTGFKLVDRYPDYYLLENDGALPRAFMAYDATFTRNDSRILDELKDPSSNWTSPLIIYGDNRTVRYPEGNSSVTVSDYQSMYVRILANTSTAGFLVLTDTYYPGWNAYVNGKKIDIMRADYAFRSVQLDAGANVVEFKYEPLSFYAGAAISLLSLFILLAVVIIAYKRKK